MVAVKCVLKASLTKSACDNIISEISILKSIRHKHVVQLLNFFHDSTFIYLIFEYCSGGNLSEFIKLKKCIKESTVQHFVQQIASAMKALRDQNISHFGMFLKYE